MKMESIVSSETSAIRTQTPGNYPKRNKLQLNVIFPGNTAASGREGYPNFRQQVPSPSSMCAGGLVTPKLMILVLLSHQHTLKMGTELFPETS